MSKVRTESTAISELKVTAVTPRVARGEERGGGGKVKVACVVCALVKQCHVFESSIYLHVIRDGDGLERQVHVFDVGTPRRPVRQTRGGRQMAQPEATEAHATPAL